MKSGVLPPSTAELNLLLDWPDQRTGPQWAAIFAASICLHLIVFMVGMQVPSLLAERSQPERSVVVRRIPLYLPRDLMTQRAPNRQRVAKQITVADLAASREVKANGGGRNASARHLEVPKQAPQQELAKNVAPQILPQAPGVAVNPNSAPSAGVPDGLPVPTPPAPAPNVGPFQNIGSEAPPNPHPKLAPPKADVAAAINGLTQSTNDRELVVSDDVPERGLPGSTGLTTQAPAQHAAVELQSDPSGADFRAYLKSILTIVRGNWRRVVPESARMGALHGRTVVEFVIDRSGGIPKLVLADSSGSQPLDRAAVAGLSMSNPLPPLPSDFKGSQVRLAFTFAYNMPAR